MNIHRSTVISAIVHVTVTLYTLMLYMEELRYDIRVTLHKNRKIHDTFKQKLTSTLNVKKMVNPLSTLNVKKYIKSNFFYIKNT